MATSPAYAATPKFGSGNVSIGDTSREMPNTVTTVLTAGAAGTRVDNIDIAAYSSTLNSMLRLWSYSGSVYSLLKEVPVTTNTVSSTNQTWQTSLSSMSNSDFLPLTLPIGYSLRVSINDSQIIASGLNNAVAASQTITIPSSTPYALVNASSGTSATIGAASLAAVAALAAPASTYYTLTSFPYVMPTPAQIALTSAGNVSTVNFLVTGTNSLGATITETIVGPNTNTVLSVNVYASILSVVTTGTPGTNTSIGYIAYAVFPKETKITISSTANLSAINFVVIGTLTNGAKSTETLVGPNAGTVTSVNTYKSISSVVPSATATPTLIGVPAIYGGFTVTARGADI